MSSPGDCAEHNWPLQILKEEGAPSYSLEELDTTTGLYAASCTTCRTT